MWALLSDTLIELARSIEPPPGCGVIVTEAEIDIPLEVGSAVHNGQLVFYGSPPHSRWKSGFLPEVHMGKLRIELIEENGSAGGLEFPG
jgi:hypothetical protein